MFDMASAAESVKAWKKYRRHGERRGALRSLIGGRKWHDCAALLSGGMAGYIRQ